MKNKEEVKLALKWFEENDVSAYEDDGSIYVVAGRDADLEISNAEVSYRAELQREFVN
jgi:hypothetical protein